jgi:hypothetical protein
MTDETQDAVDAIASEILNSISLQLEELEPRIAYPQHRAELRRIIGSLTSLRADMAPEEDE